MTRAIFRFFIAFILPAQFLFSQETGSESFTKDPQWGHILISPNHTKYHYENFKSISEKPFSIEAVYDTQECSNTLTSIQVYNAHLPLTWYELDEQGQRVHILFNPQLNYFNNHTTYVVEDFSKHTDTIYIDFHQSLAVEKIYPNPHRGVLFIDYAAMEPTEMDIKMFDIAGRVVLDGVHVLNEGTNQLRLEISHLQQGIYFLNLHGSCISELRKIIHLK